METDITKDYVFSGDVSITTNINPDYGNGNLEVQGTTYTDTIKANTIGNPVNIENINILNGNIVIPSQNTIPIAPNINTFKFFINPANNLLCSIDYLGTLTTYQPINSKGDILTRNITTQVRLPVGEDNAVLVADSSTSTGLKWSNTIISQSNTLNKIQIMGNDSTTKNIIVEYPIGCYSLNIYPDIVKGGSCNFFISRCSPSSTGNIIRLNNNPSLINAGNLQVVWDNYSGYSIYKDSVDASGMYKYNDSSNQSNINIILTGTSTSQIYSQISGSFMFNITSLLGKPVATFICCKSNSSSITGNIIRINTTTINGTTLNITWPANSGIQLSKSSNLYDGTYKIIDIFKNQLFNTKITLAGTSNFFIDVDIFPYYTQKSFFVKIESTVLNGPNAIFTVSKNSEILGGNITTFRSPGTSSGEILSLVWPSISNLSVSKNGNNYDGIYNVTFTQLI